MSGLFAPECNGAVEPHKSRMMRAFRVVSSSDALPATVVTPSKLVNLAATIKANASSCPGSQSRMMFGDSAMTDEHKLRSLYDQSRLV